MKYQSLSSPKPRTRWIAPTSIVFDGFHWHARPFYLTDEDFVDFLLSGIFDMRGAHTNDDSADNGRDRHSEVTLDVGPHPDLTTTQAKAIALDYGERDGRADFKVQRALFYYALRRLGLSTDMASRRPQDQQTIVPNTAELVCELENVARLSRR